MKIAIIGAMSEEITPLLDFFNNYKTIEIAGNSYYQTSYKNHEIFIATSKIGKIHAALTCSCMIFKFNVDCVIFTGVAGGLSKDLRVGDIILADSLCQYDVDISAFGHPLGFIPDSKIFIHTNEKLNNTLKNAAKKHNIPIKSGIIASGDTFISDSIKKDWIIQHFNASAVEMEGASIAVVCDACKIPFCVIRSISDSADSAANISFDEFLVESASKSAKLVLSMLDEM